MVQQPAFYTSPSRTAGPKSTMFPSVLYPSTSSKKDRLEEYLAVADLPHLTDDEIAAIDKAGAEGPPTLLKNVDFRTLAACALCICVYLLRDVFSYFRRSS
ncbi:putative aldo keto reductase [Lyophyllum shimeji]|uniref:Aldo keto reductase n=1 Tax=Lyophyllum shimeji TaxID=47721 RepID=A0A9P3PVZ7_LYOSH|nr:putative aldo keto reductase [Lyophyllum shimeji]